MRVLLVKCHKKTIFSRIEPILTEPLELELISSMLNGLKIDYRIYDPLLEGGTFERIYKEYKPEVLLLSGYITAVDVIKDYSRFAKKQNKRVKVIVGGVHAELNYEDFFIDSIDIIVHSDGLNTLEQLLKADFISEYIAEIEGIAYIEYGKWKINKKVTTCIGNIPLPDRSYFEKHKFKTKYLNYSPIAIVKTALSCPYSCNFCYCKLLNSGVYSHRSITSVIEEIKEIDNEHIWIVDDTFLIDKERVLNFINEVKREALNKKFIAYSRVDFIANNEDIIKKLSEIGFVELIVGIEAVDDIKLDNFNKNVTSNDNIKAVEILKKHNIILTALFIVGIDFKIKDFRNMRQWIKKMKLQSYTASIFTPIKGTPLYKNYENQLITQDNSKYDFLHLTLKPIYMNRIFFYLQFYLIYIEQIFHSKYLRKFMLKNIKRFTIAGGKNE